LLGETTLDLTPIVGQLTDVLGVGIRQNLAKLPCQEVWAEAIAELEASLPPATGVSEQSPTKAVSGKSWSGWKPRVA